MMPDFQHSSFVKECYFGGGKMTACIKSLSLQSGKDAFFLYHLYLPMGKA